MIPNAFPQPARDSLYRLLASRRDVRSGFLPQPLPSELLTLLLTAAHTAPSVGLMQPTRFLVIQQEALRRQVHAAFTAANEQAARIYSGTSQDLYASLKLEGLREAPQHLCICCEADSIRGRKLGRQTMPETALYSTVCAIQNLWLAARAEGVGVGWVSILEPEELRAILGIPPHLTIVAYLCLGFVDSFATEPELERAGWESRLPLEAVVSYDTFAEPSV